MDMEKIAADAANYRTKFAVDKAVDSWREEHQAEAAAEEASKSMLDRISDTVSDVAEDVADSNIWGTARTVLSDVADAYNKAGEARMAFLHEGANLQDKARQGQVTNEDVETLRQSGRDASVAMTNIAASPFRQAARSFIQNNADNESSPFQSVAQSLQQTDVNLEYFMTPEEKLQKSREIEQALGLPAETTLSSNEAYKEALEMYNYKQKTDSIEDVWDKYPELQRIAGLDKEAAAIALHNMRDVKETHGVIDTFMSFLSQGNTELEYNNLQYKIMTGRATDEEVQRADQLKTQMEKDKREAPGFFQDPLGSMAAGVGGSLPEMGQSIAGAVAGVSATSAALTVAAVAGTVLSGGTSALAAAGIAGMRTLIMRTLASEAGKSLLKNVAMAGAWQGMAAPESGARYAQNKAMTKQDGTPLYTDDEAKMWALLGGYTNAAIEVLPTMKVGAKALPATAKVFQQEVGTIVNQTMGRETLKDLGTAAMGNWLKLTTTESAEEAVQSVADDVIGNAALASKGQDAAHYQKYGVGDILTRAGGAFVESLPGSMGFGLAGVGAGAVTGVGRLARSRKRMAEMENQYGKQQAQTMMGVMAVEQLQKAVENGNLHKVAPDVQKKVLHEQLAGTAFETAHIDIEMALQKENGREDLKKIAEAQGMSADDLETAISVNGYMTVDTETLAQAKASPDILDSVSFSTEAESMARMRENGKRILEDYQKNFDKLVQRQQNLIDMIAKEFLPEGTTDEQKDALRAVMMQNLSNPAQGWNELRKSYMDELYNRIGPALDALKKGMGNAGLMEVDDEQGNKKTIRYTENDEWYRNFYKTFKRQPTQAELEDMAIAMTIGDSAAPKVAGWIVDSAEAQEAFEQEKPIIDSLKHSIELLDSIKTEAKKLTGVEMELTEGMSPEAFKVYRALSSWTAKAGGKIGRSGRMSALLVARHADIFAEAVRKNTGKKDYTAEDYLRERLEKDYTAEDYLRERLGFQLVQQGQEIKAGLNQMAGVQAENAPLESLRRAKTMDGNSTPDEIYKETGWIKGQDGKWRFEIPDNLDAVNWDVFKKGNTENKSRLLKYVYKNKKLYEAYPWLENINVEVRQMEGNTYGGVAKNYNGSYIVIKEDVGDEQKSGTLIHEIQHLIQDEEGFAVGGTDENANEQIIDRIRELNKRIQSYDYGAEYADTVMDQQEMILEGVENPEAEEMLKSQIAELEKKIPAKERDEIWQLASDRQYLRDTLDENAGDDYSLYKNLAGEQEARHATDRAIIHTNVVRAEKELAEKKAKYEAEKAKQSPAMKKMLDELETLREKDEKTDAEYDRIDEIKAAMDDKLMQAETFYSWAKDTLEMRRREAAETPQPHDEDAIVVFGGQEMAMSQEPRTLAAYHNTRVDNLEKLLEQGLAVPSIAITHKDIPYDNFGDVTLVGNRNLIDPESGVPVWTRDAYTTRIPRAEYLPTEKKKIKAFMDKWRKNLQGIGEWEYVLDRLEEAAQEDPERVEARTHREEFTYYYLTKVLGRDVELKHIRPDYEVPILRNGIYADQIESIMHSKKKKAEKKKDLTEVFIAKYEKALAEYAESIPKKKAYLDAQPSPKRKMMYERALERQRETQDKLATIKQTGEISEEQYKEIQKDISRVDKAENESTEINWSKTFSEMRTNNKDALNSDKYQQWQDKLVDDIRGDAVIKIGRKYEPYTTDNIVRAMLTEKGAGKEGGLGFSTSKAAAIGATPLKSIADLHKNESRLVTREQANSVIADVDTAIDESFEEVREYHKNIAADSYSLPEIFNEAVANAIKGGKKATAANMKTALKKMDFDVAKIPASAINKAVDAANKMREAAAWYFEAKPQRAVGINEFSGAVVPEDTPAETIKKLINNGLTVETYNPEVAGDRQRATKAVQEKRAETLFQRAWYGSPYDFETFDLGAIGTGEGAQAHGWGLYFAANRAVSEEYKNVLGQSQGKKLYIDGKEHEWSTDNVNDKAMKALISTVRSVGDVSKVRQKLEKLKQTEEVKQALKYIDEGRVNVDYSGKLFEVEIPDNDVLLDEQKSFTQQSKTVQESIKKVFTDLSIENKLLLSTNEPVIKDYVDLKYRLKQAVDSLDKAIKLPKFKNMILSDMVDNRLIDYLTAEKIRQDESLLIQKREAKASQLEKVTKELQEKLANTDLASEYKNKTGKEIYTRISQLLGDDKKASEEFNKNGVKGITYDGGRDGRCFVVFDDKAISVIEKYNQQARESLKSQGGITINPDADGRRIISILETADESTFMHEMAHAFLFDLEDLAQIDETSKKELEIVNQWATWEKGAAEEYKGTAWAKEFADREQAIIDAEAAGDYDHADKLKAEWRQERFARGFELYLKDGQAPARGLKAVFRKFKSFLVAIYKQFVGDGGKPTLPVKRVMDRMIASEDEIEAAALEDRYSDLTKAGGEKLLTETEEVTMKRWYEEERAAAKEKIMKLVMKDLEKDRQKEYENKLAEERERYEGQLKQEDVFVARRAYEYTGNKNIVTEWFNTVEDFEAIDSITPALDTLVDEHMKEYGEKLDESLIDSHLSKDAIDKAMDSSKYRVKMENMITKGMERKKSLMNRINAKARAAMSSIEEKLNALPEDVDIQLEKNDNPTIKSIMKEINKLRFANKWDTADINHIEAMLRASTQADVRKALKEFKDKKYAEKKDLEDVESATKGMESMYKDQIKQTMESKPMTETCNVKYYMDKARNAGRRVNAMIKIKNWDMAVQQQRQKVFYSMMVKQARENKEARDRMVKDLSDKLNRKTVKLPKDERYWFNRILYLMKINKVDPKIPEGGVAKLNDIYKEQQKTLDVLVGPEMLERIQNEGDNFGDYNKLSLSEFRSAYEDLVRLYTIGKDKFNFKSIAGRSIEEVALAIMTDGTANRNIMTLTRKIGPDQGGLNYIDAIGNLGQAGHTVARGIQMYQNSILKPENILELLGKIAQKYIYGLLERAAEQEAKLMEKNLRTLQSICSVYSREERQSWSDQQYDFPGTKGWKITKENVFAMALNWGTETNRQRLIGGLIEDGQYKSEKSAQKVQNAIETLFRDVMTKKDWDFVQKLWDHIGSFWHDTAAVEEKLNGIALGRVENLPFEIETADGQTVKLKGGYMHIKYDFEKSSRAEEQEIEDMAMSITAGARVLGVGRSMAKARSQSNIYRELDLHFSVVENHLQDVIHNICYRVPLRDIYRLLHYKNYSSGVNLEEYLRKGLGVDAYREIDAWTLDAWRQVGDNRNSAESSTNKFFRWVRSNSTMAIMGFRLKPVLDNLGNIPIAMNQVGSLKMLGALYKFYANGREENFREVNKLSAFMRTRAENLDRDLRQQPGVFRAGNRLMEFAREHAYDALVWTDLAVSAPLWKQAYTDSFAEKIKEVQKENEENIKKRLELAAQADEIRAQIAALHNAAAGIDEHLRVRRYGTPAEIEALRETEYAGLSDAELRAQWGEHKKEARELGKDLFKVEQEQEQANQLPVYTDDELLEEAKQRAVFAADKAVRDTFGSGRVIDQAAISRSKNELVRLFTAFYSFFNAQYNLIYMSYMKSKYPPNGTDNIARWAPLAKTVMFNVILSSLITSAVAFSLGLKGDDKDEKERAVTTADGKREKQEIPISERFLKAWAKEALSVGTGGMYGVRDVTQLLGDLIFSGQNYGYKMGSVATRGFAEAGKAFVLVMKKGEKDAEIQAQQDKREREHREKLKKYTGKKRREYLAKWKEEQKYRKPPKRITYSEILGHAAAGAATLTAARTGITTTMTNAITGTMQYMLDTDMRFDPTWKNIVWSAIFDKRPVEREIPKKPPTEPKKKKNKQ